MLEIRGYHEIRNICDLWGMRDATLNVRRKFLISSLRGMLTCFHFCQNQMPVAERWMLNIKHVMHPFKFYFASIMWKLFDVRYPGISHWQHNVTIALCKQRKYQLHEDNIVQSQQCITTSSSLLPVLFNDVWCLQIFYR